MASRLRLVLALHQHQPVGNLDSVVERVYRETYLPLVETLADYPTLPVNLHISGSLIDWLEARRADYLPRVRALAASGRIEILGGAYHDPLLPLLPSMDRQGQIRSLGRRLGRVFGHVPRGMWLPERVWDPSLTADLADADIEHTILDDFHFHAAGLTNDQLRGYYLTEAEGRLIAVFAGDEQLRYLIPFAEPEEVVAYLRSVWQANPNGTIVYADDAEKFGTWPGMRERMQNGGWLRRFLDALTVQTDWLQVTTLGECIDHVPPLGKVYVPEGSYAEMAIWSSLSSAPCGPTWQGGTGPASALLRNGTGTWRNFRVRYPEVDEMYCRMLRVSKRCATADGDEQFIEQARQALHRGQCGCSYWHGIFGGVYLPHLRQAVYRNLIEAENLLDQAAGRVEPWLSASIDDYNLDVHKELLISNSRVSLLFAPDRGGQLSELDVRDIGLNLLATLTRRPEPYHATLRSDQATGSPGQSPAAAIVDSYSRKSLLDHFYDPGTGLHSVVSGNAAERGDFLEARYRTRMRRVGDGVCVQLTRRGAVAGQPLNVTKQVTLWEDRPVLDVRYELTGLPPGRPWCFAVEFNFAGLPAGCADRYFVDASGNRLAELGRQIDLVEARSLRLVDHWQGLEIALGASRSTGFWAHPIHSTSRSQHGLEMIQQSVAVLPHWTVIGDARGCWSVDLQLALTTPHKVMPRGVDPFAESLAVTPNDSAQQFIVDGPHGPARPLSSPAIRAFRVYEE